MKNKMLMMVCGLSFFAAFSVYADEAPHRLEPYCQVSTSREYISLGKFSLPSTPSLILPAIYALLPKLEQACANYGAGSMVVFR